AFAIIVELTSMAAAAPPLIRPYCKRPCPLLFRESSINFNFQPVFWGRSPHY
ncbi:hypothetical protein S245_040587, partial [Arachis hypogaea]